MSGILNNIKDALVSDILSQVTTTNGYDITVKKTENTEIPFPSVETKYSPSVGLLQLNESTRVVTASNGYLNLLPITFMVYVNAAKPTQIDRDISDTVTSIRRYCDRRDPHSVHANLHGIYTIQDSGIFHSESVSTQGGTGVLVNLVYNETTNYSRSSDSPLTTISTLDDTRDHLVTILNNFSGSASSPDIAYNQVYSQHNTVISNFNAVSIDLREYDSTPSGLDEGVVTFYESVWTIRVHTDYIGGRIDSVETLRLMEDISHYLQGRKFQLGGSQTFYHIEKVLASSPVLRQFNESYTVGGEIQLLLKNIKSHTQV